MNAEPPLFGSAPSVPPQPAGAPGPGKDERLWATFAHLAALAGLVVPIPVANLIGPLVVWLIKKDEYPFVNDQGKESVNFQISMTIYLLVGILLCFVLIGFLVLAALAIFQLIVVIVAAVKANEGVAFRYPACIRFIK